MNFRAGCQRLYAVITVAWFGIVIVATPPGKLRFWEGVKVEIGSPVNVSPGCIAVSSNASKAPKDSWDKAFDELCDEEKQQASKPPPKTVNVDGQIFQFPGDFTNGHIQDMLHIESRWRKAMSLAGMLFLPPAIGYVLLFYIVRWIYRGFRPTTRVAS